MSPRICCAVCDAPMRASRNPWCFACPACGFLASNLTPHIGDGQLAERIDEQQRELALVRLRQRSSAQILDRVDALTESSRRSLLEVGCAHGWFLDAAARRGYAVQGLEADASIGARASSKGHDVAFGFFPQALPPAAHYDVIVFNDVFEHLPAPRAALAACRRRLRAGGLLVLNLPSSAGTLFRIAKLLDRLGISAPHERMWQKDFPSPHLSYFHPDALTRLAEREGFAEIYRGRLDSLDRGALKPRLRLDRRVSSLGALVTGIGVIALSPLLGWLPPDISLQIYKAPETPPPSSRPG